MLTEMKIANIIALCTVGDAVDMNKVIAMTCGGKTTMLLDECRRYIAENELPFTMTTESSEESIRERLEAYLT